MWYMIDYENVHEDGLYGIEMLKKDDKIFVFLIWVIKKMLKTVN